MNKMYYQLFVQTYIPNSFPIVLSAVVPVPGVCDGPVCTDHTRRSPLRGRNRHTAKKLMIASNVHVAKGSSVIEI